MIKSDHLVKKHQIHVLKPLRVAGIQTQGRLGVFQIVVGEISDKAAGKGRKVGKPGAFVFLDYLTDIVSWIPGLNGG